MINRKIAISALSILSAGAIMTGATFAFFSDVGASNDNVFNSGTMDMVLSDLDQTGETVTATWGLASNPGDVFTGDLKIKNSGSTPADHIELKFTNIVTNASSGPGTVSTTPFDQVIEIQTFGWDSDGNGSTDVDLLPGVNDFNANGIKDLDDLENQSLDDFDNLTFGGTQNADHFLTIAGRMSPTLAVDQHQGDSVSMDLDVTMNQDTSQ